MQEDQEGEALVRDQGEQRQQGEGDQRPEQRRHLWPGEESQQQALLCTANLNLISYNFCAEKNIQENNINKEDNEENNQDDF